MNEPRPVVLVVDDEPQMRRFLRSSLGSHGYKVIEASTAREAIQLVSSHNPELMLLDLRLPDRDGIEVVRELRTWSRVPIIVVSARGEEESKIGALDAGADDYLTKPFGVRELLARIRVGLRHAMSADDPVFELGPLRIDRESRTVWIDGREAHLTAIEYKILALLAANAGRVVTHKQILAEVWGPTHVHETHYVRVHMVELRKKIEDDPSRPRLITTEPGVGYRLREKS